MRIILALFAVIALSRAAAAQDAFLMCTQMWCDEGLRVTFDAAKWPAGDYKIELLADDKSIKCTATLPFKDCEGGQFTCDSPDLQVTTEGCALPKDQHKLGGIWMQIPPQKVMLTLTQPDGKKSSLDTAVDPQCSWPNGEQCDERECCSAQYTLSVK